MYEDKTTAVIHEDMLDQVNNDYDKAVGSFMYDATRPAAIELEKAYQAMDSIIQKLSLGNLSGDELEQRVYEQTGLKRKEATKATGVLTITGTGTITEGDIFQTGSGVQFIAKETKIITDVGIINIESVEAGSLGNMPSNTVNIMASTIQGIIGVNNDEPIEGGYDAEEDEALLERYYEKKQSPATSGNIAQYRIWAKEVAGVGDAKIIPLWNGDNTVKVIIIDADKQPASHSLVDTVQEYIDPSSIGLGDGVAPIGAKCTVESAIGVPIDVSFTLIKDSAYTDDAVRTNIEQALRTYFEGIAFEDNKVSYAAIGYFILTAEGVNDHENLMVNGGTSNIIIGDLEVPVLGVMTIG